MSLVSLLGHFFVVASLLNKTIMFFQSEIPKIVYLKSYLSNNTIVYFEF